MQLTPSESERFYRVWFSMLWYANESYKVIKHLPNPSDPAKLTIHMNDAVQIRDKVWVDDSILDRIDWNIAQDALENL